MVTWGLQVPQVNRDNKEMQDHQASEALLGKWEKADCKVLKDSLVSKVLRVKTDSPDL